MTEFAINYWRRACQALATARQSAQTDPNAAASRAYYAAFYAVTALFALREQYFTKHAQLRAAVHRDLVNNEHMDPAFGKAFDALVALRDTGDYGGTANVFPEQADQAVEMAKMIVETVGRLCSLP